MATNVENREQWTSSDYIHYFSNSSRFMGVAESFIDIASLMDRLHELDQEPVSDDMVFERGKLLDQIMEEATEYASSHKDARSSDGIRRREVMEALTAFCDKEKRYTSLDANIRYFSGKSVQDIRNGITLDDFEQIERKIADLESQPMDNEEHVIEYVNTITRYVQAAESYMHVNDGRKEIGQKWDRTQMDSNRMRGEGSNMYAKSQGILNDYKPCLDSARDLKQIRALIADGKSWDDLRALRTPHIVHKGKQEVLGANVNQRIKVTTEDGVTGFFTQEVLIGQSVRQAIQKYADEMPTRTGRILLENKELLGGFQTDSKMKGITSATPQNQVFLKLCEGWNQMEASPEKSARKQFLNELDGSVVLGEVLKHLSERKKHANPYEITKTDWIKKNYTEIVKEKIKDPKKYALLMDHVDFITEGIRQAGELNTLSEAEKTMATVDLHAYQYMLKQDETTITGLNAIYAGNRLINSKEAKSEFITLQGQVSAGRNRSIGKFDEKDGGELTGRNVLTSRIAELLNVGKLVAHAEKMTVEMDGVTRSGCFMEYAQGMDAGNASKSYDDLYELMKTDPNRVTEGLARDSATLNLLDVICAQYDRHARNFFQILGPEKDDGTREVIGLQAIDNDQAFSRNILNSEYGLDSNERSAGLNQIKLIDKALADRITSITPDMIRYTVGDILSETETQSLISRMETVQKHINANKMIRLEGHEWDMDQYTAPKTKEEREFAETEKGKELAKISQDMRINVNVSSLAPWSIKKSNVAGVQSNWVNAKKAIREDIEKQMPKKKSEEQLRLKRAAIFDRIADSFETASKPKAASEREKTSFAELDRAEKQQKASERGIEIGAERKKQAKKELDLGFAEITRDDIREANKNVKKPIIGAHRGPRK